MIHVNAHNAKIDATKTNHPIFMDIRLTLCLVLLSSSFLDISILLEFLWVQNQKQFVSMKLKSLKWLSKLNNINQKYPLLRPFDGKFPDKCEPYAQTVKFACINDRVIQFNLIFRRFRSSAKKRKAKKINFLIFYPQADVFVSLCFSLL